MKKTVSAKEKMSVKPTNNDACPCMDPCPMLHAMRILSGKWKMSILCTLWLNGSLRYKELFRFVDGVTDTMLSASLKELERDGLIVRTQYNEMPLRAEYSLSDKGLELMPLLSSVVEWSKGLLKGNAKGECV